MNGPVKRQSVALYLILVAGLLWIGDEAAAFGNAVQLQASERPVKWATPLHKAGLSNFYRVSPVLFRGAQPMPEGLSSLQKMGVRTIVSLRGFHADRFPQDTKDLSYVSIRFHTWHPEEEDVVRFLKVVTDPARQPVFVHCERGIDRTGMMVALYRVAVQGWSKDEAVREMTQGGFGYDDYFPNLVAYVRHADIEKLRREADIPKAPNSR